MILFLHAFVCNHAIAKLWILIQRLLCLIYFLCNSELIYSLIGTVVTKHDSDISHRKTNWKKLEYLNKYLTDHIFELRRKIWIYGWSSQLYTQLEQLWSFIEARKKFRPERDSNPWPLRYRCSALPTELSSHPGAGHIVSSYYTRRSWRM